MNWHDPFWFMEYGIWVDHIFSAKRPNRDKLALIVVLAGFVFVVLAILATLLLLLTNAFDDEMFIGLIVGLILFAGLTAIVGLIILRGRSREFLNSSLNTRRNRKQREKKSSSDTE